MKRACVLLAKGGRFKRAIDLGKRTESEEVIGGVEGEAVLQGDLRRNDLVHAQKDYISKVSRLRTVQQ